MPGKAKPASEYKKRFRWHESYRSSSFKPSSDQTMPSAGLPSSTIGQVKKDVIEPPLQHRRKPLDNTVKRTYTTSQFYNPTLSSSEDGSIPQRKPPTKKHTKRHNNGPKQRSPPQNHDRPNSSPPEAQLAATRILSKNDQNKNKMSGAKDDKHKTYLKLTNGHHSSGAANGGSSGGSKSKDGHRSSNDSGKSSKKPHDVDAALQYQAGIRARPLGPRYLSEYQRQFAWKQANKESPMLAADELVHKSSTNLTPFDPSKIPKKTEYNTQFKAYYPPAPSLQQQLQENVDREMKAKYKVKTKSKKNKKVHLSPEQLKTAGMPSVVVHEDAKLLEAAQNPHKPFFPHAAVRKWRSEYHSNFKPPSLFSYEDGVWKGANPPHIQPQDSSSEPDRQNKLRHAKSEGDIPSWFAEVLELRNRAQEYQKRAHGTHFSRERLVQLLTGAKATGESSTAVSSSSLTTSLSDIHEGAQQITKTINEKVPESNKQQNEERSRKEPSPVRRKLAWGENEKKEEVSRDRSSSYGSIPTPDGYRGSVSDTSEDASVLSEEGRLPTPRLETGGQKQRHHLDKTTPASGGAILTSPPRRKDVRPRPRTAPSGAMSSHRTNAALRPQTRPSAEVINGSGVSTSLGLERNGVKNLQERAKAILPGGISGAFDYDSDEDDDDDNNSLSSKEEGVSPDRTLTPPRTPPKDPTEVNKGAQIQSSPAAGRKTNDPDPLSPDHRPVRTFQRHSNHYFETSPAMPVMPTKVEPPKTLAGPRGPPPAADDKMNPKNGKTYSLKDGPLNRPSSGNMYGRPQTAYPQTREHAAEVASHRVDAEDRPNSFIFGDLPDKTPRKQNGLSSQTWSPQKHHEDRDSDELSLSTLSSHSSVSLASEVLERAKKRRDDFWGKKMR